MNSQNGRSPGGFRWTERATRAAIALAEGQTRAEVIRETPIPESTLYRWLADDAFSAEVDRLSLMVGIAAKAERLRIAQRVVREKVTGETVATDKDLLDWLKFAQSETDGIKLDLAKVAAAFRADAEPVAD